MKVVQIDPPNDFQGPCTTPIHGGPPQRALLRTAPTERGARTSTKFQLKSQGVQAKANTGGNQDVASLEA